ncbi:MAG: hypothetical protein JWO54_361 [Candidatus Saccharibacteria bacterium]|nr:hypothetical protein [Candidatus Saccharibacteria bacterium]
MIGNKVSAEKKKIISNIVYSFLVFFILFAVGLGVIDPATINSASNHTQLSSKAFVIFGISLALAVVFSIWYGRKTRSK